MTAKTSAPWAVLFLGLATAALVGCTPAAPASTASPTETPMPALTATPVPSPAPTFTPTPTYTLTRDYKYKAGWALTGSSGSETYATMGDEEAQIVMLKAKQLAMEKISNAQASAGGMKYSLGAVSVDKGAGAESLTTMMYALHGEFVQACERYNGAAAFA